jgi:hypothetical protein
MENPEKPATQDTQDEDKQNKNTTQYMSDTSTRKQTLLFEHSNLLNINYVRFKILVTRLVYIDQITHLNKLVIYCFY